MKKILFTILASSQLFFSFGQIEIPQIIPSSPTAASLGRYGEIPVGMYTGIPQIHIPLYKVLIDNIEIPIELNYSATGAKVEEIAPWVGLGWSLNAGGVITRTVRGSDDLTSVKYYETVKNFKQLSTQESYGTFIPKTLSQLSYLENITGNTAMDTEPDIFYFNFGNYTGKFILYPDGNYYSLPLNNMQIKKENVNGGKTRWLITTDDGCKYYFGANDDNIEKAIETTETSESIRGFAENSWYLTRVVTPNNRQINFNYISEDYSFFTAPIVTKYTRLTPLGFTDQTYAGSPENHQMSAVRLNSIDFDNGIIKFESSMQRYDLDGTAALTDLRVYAKEDDELHEIKKINFKYSYFSSTGSISAAALKANNIDIHDKQKNANYYLKLDSLNIEVGNLKLPPYSFLYNSIFLPGRLSSSIDHWGYYNGKSNGQNRLPNTYYLSYSSGEVSYQYSSSEANKDPDTVLMRACNLEQINYPSGGYSKFTYESNIVDPTYSSRPLYSINGNYVGSSSTIVQKSASCQIFSNTNSQGLEDTGDIMEFEIAQDAKVTFSVSMSGQLSTFVPYCFSLEIKNLDNNVGYSYSVTQLNGVTQIGSVNLHSGRYQMYLIKDKGGSCSNISYIVMRGSAKWQEIQIDSTLQPNNLIVGGLRIKRIDKYDNLTNAHYIKDFYYTRFDDSSKSSGSVVSFPVYLFKVNGTQTLNANMDIDIKYSAIYQSTSSYPLQTTSGSFVGYSNVKVKSYSTNSDTNTIISKYYYTSPEDFPDSIYDGKQYSQNRATDYSLEMIPIELRKLPPTAFPPTGSIDWKRGLLLKSEDYINTPAGNRLQKKVTNQYSVQRSASLQKKALGLKFYQVENRVAYETPILFNIPPFFICNFYNTPSDFTYLSSTDETIYDNYNRPITKHKEFNYNDSNNLRLSEVMELNSKGDSIKTNYYYSTNRTTLINLPADNNTIRAMDSLLKRNDRSTVIFETTSLNNKNLSSVLNHFNFFNNKPHLSTISQRINGGPFINIISYNKYDNYGNILEVQKANSYKTDYLWGYNGQYPIAQINGIDFDVLKLHIDTSILHHGTQAQIDAQINNLRSFLAPNPLVTMSSYTYSPLIGIKTEVDPKGKILQYKYDNLGRLISIKDQNDNTIRTFRYHVKNE